MGASTPPAPSAVQLAARVPSQTSRSFRAAVVVAVLVGLIAAIVMWKRTDRRRAADIAQVDARSEALAGALIPSARAALRRPDSAALVTLSAALDGFGPVLGFAVYRANDSVLASGRALRGFADSVPDQLRDNLARHDTAAATVHWQGLPVRLMALTMPGRDTASRGTIVAAQNISSIEQAAGRRLTRAGLWILFLMFLLTMLVVGVTWLVYDRQLHKLAVWMRRVRTENLPELPPAGLPVALLLSESSRLAASFRAARSSGVAKSEAAVRAEQVWTRERLRTRAIACVKHGQLIVVSNREPYLHRHVDGTREVVRPPGGLVSALDPVLQACGGLWVAQGSGDADREAADVFGRLQVPPGDPRYTLRRVWITPAEERGYYYGFANEGLWPLCHLAHERPVFRAEDWEMYVRVNQRFADTVIEEVGDGDALVLVQDYQLALVPQMIKAQRPGLRVAIFWHIPWPSYESFRICPYRVEILQGMLGADLIGFHLRQFSNVFFDSIERMMEARVDRDHFDVEWRGHMAHVRAFPISVETWVDRTIDSDATAMLTADLRQRFDVPAVVLGVGVDRIDYTKGLPERLRAIGRFFDKYPEYRSRFTFVQVAAPSRTGIARYRKLADDLKNLADDINARMRTETWQPIHLLIGAADGATVHAYLGLASICIVSSLHDGMNLVAKEYVAAQESAKGVLILSEFAGAARELSDAVIINPYDIENFADAIRAALEMPADERAERMTRMRRTVEDHNVYRWAANLLTALAEIDPLATPSTTAPSWEAQVPT